MLLVVFVGHTHMDKELIKYKLLWPLYTLFADTMWLVKFLLKITFNISKSAWNCLYTGVLALNDIYGHKIDTFTCIARAQNCLRSIVKGGQIS